VLASAFRTVASGPLLGTFWNVLGEHFIFIKKEDMSSKKGCMEALFSNATPMRPGQIWVRQTQNLTVTSGDLSWCVLCTWLSIGLEFTRFRYL